MGNTTKRVRQVRKPTSIPKKDPIELPIVPKLFSGIIHTRQEINPEAEWKELRAWLELQPSTIQDMRQCVRESANMSARAKDLYDLTKIHHGRFRIEYRARLQLWRKEAIVYWECIKRDEGLHKQITEQMLEDQIIEEHAEEYADLQERMQEMDALKESFKSLIDSTISKGIDNRKLLESEARRPTSSPSWMDGKQKK